MGERDEIQATGVAAVLLIDTLLKLGIEDPTALTYEQKVEVIEQAESEGRLGKDRLLALREMGAIPPTRSSES
jgi:hypothetical protein